MNLYYKLHTYKLIKVSDKIHWITRAHYPDPLVDYSNTDFILDFNDAVSVLQQWRNPNLGRSSREGTVISLASNAKSAYRLIQEQLLTTILPEEKEKQLIEKLKVYRFLLDQTLPQALELVNLDKLITPEDIKQFINRQLELMRQEYGRELKFAENMLNELEAISDIEVKDDYGKSRRISRNDVLDVLGSVLGNILLRQVSLWQVDDYISRPRGRMNLKKTYRAAIMREGKVPPKQIRNEDIKVMDKDRVSLIYFIVDLSQSMNKTVFKDGLTRLDGSLLTSLGLYYYFKLVNRRKRREFDSFNMHVIPVDKNPYVIANDEKFETFLMEAEGKGKTRLVHATYSAIRHVQENYQNVKYDVQLVYLTDGRPNVPFDGTIYGNSMDFGYEKYLSESDSKIPKEAKMCMVQLNKTFNYLKRVKDRNWKISYFLMASDKFMQSSLYRDTKKMLSGITDPVLIDPTEIDNLGRRILQETIVNEN